MDNNNYTVLHLHTMLSNPYSGLEVDSIANYKEYIDEAEKCGMKAIAFTEHGCILQHVAKKQYCEKKGIKYIHGEEFYVTESIELKESDESNLLTRDNYHCILLAKNEKGVRELNKLSSDSFNREDGHFYYNPRITMDELENTSDNILILTACVAGILCKGTKTIQERFLKFIIKNKHRCWLEIQPHDMDLQIQYNRYLYQISIQYGLKLIATSDVHAIGEDQIDGRKKMQLSKNIEFTDEDSADLSWKNYYELVEAFKVQGAIPESEFTKAIQETNNLADMVEDYTLDYSNKYPRFKDSEKEFKKRITQGIKERGINKLPNYKTQYVPRIIEEYKTYQHNDTIDFMLLDSDYKTWMRENNMRYGVSRGSVSGSLIAYLSHCTDVDSVKYKLNFSRFMNQERVSLADIDTDIYAEDRYKVREYLFGREDLYCCNIITYNTIQMKAAIKDIGRALGMTPDQTQNISDMVTTDDNGKNSIDDEIRALYPELFKYVDIVIGTITSLGRHAAGIVCSPTDIEYDFGTLTIKSDPRPVSQIDMHEIDSLNYVKLDLLGLNAVGLIKQTCDFANIEYLTPDNVDFNDKNVIDSIAEDTTMIFQFESGFASSSLRKTLNKEILNKIMKHNKDITYLDIISMVSGAIRPAGESYREQLFNGIYKDNGHESLNKFLNPTLGYLVYQEQVIEFLYEFCGFTMGQADVVRRCVEENTLITLADNTTKPIKDIVVGDEVKCFGNDGYIKTSIVDNVFDNGINIIYEIITDNGLILKATKEHKVLTQYGWVKVKDLTNKHCLTMKSRFVKIASIKEIGEAHVYDIEVRDYHNYIANGLVVHNCFAKKTGTQDAIPVIENGGYLIDNKGNKDNRYIKGFISTVKEKFNIEEEEARKLVKDFLVVIEDASSYLFSRNHSIPYSMIGFFIGYLRYYYPLELITAALNIYKDNKAKMLEIKGYAKTKGITLKNIKFGKSKAEYFMDKDENAIYQGIASIKFCNSIIADELYELSKNNYSSFINLLADIKTKTSTDSRQIRILVVLNFFSDFGNNQKLLNMIDVFDKYYESKIIQKSSLNDDEYEIIKKYSAKETAKQFREIDNIGLINELCANIEDKKLSIKEQLESEKEYLESIVYINPKMKDLYYVDELRTFKDKTKPYLTLYNLSTGEYVNTKIKNGNLFIENSFKVGSFIKVLNFKDSFKSKNINGKWVKTNETEKILNKWEVLC